MTANSSRVAEFLLACLAVAACRDAHAQLPRPGAASGGHLARLPNDQVEGAIWEYQGSPKFQPKKDEKVPKLGGKFRVEETAIYEVGGRFKLPGRKGIKEAIDAAKDGEGGELKLPDAPTPKRIGQFSLLSKSRLRIEVDDGKDFHGIVVAQRKNKTADIWIGEYTEMEMKDKKQRKTGRQWQIELRPIQD